jgi:putative radical SAM enzyme (TIGR03279 family)
MEHKIISVQPGSIADELEIEAGDILLLVNGNEISDIFDYQYYCNEEYLTVLIRKQDGEEWELEIEKEYEEDLGMEFGEGLMDQYKSCRNQCVFCFIDQMPPGMRETLYFKDDDARLSFLQGNYITLTNMSEKDLDRILHYHMSPVNISVHTTNPDLRCKMLHNRFAGMEALDKIQKLYDGGIEMNSQIVLCKGINDGAELDRSIEDLSRFYPYMQSLSVVPVGLTKYRDGLAKLQKFEKEDAREVLAQIERWQKKLYETLGTRFVHASDEWFLTAGREIPSADYYEGYGQIENGVGMIRSLEDEVEDALLEYEEKGLLPKEREICISLATGVLAAPVMEEILQKAAGYLPKFSYRVYSIENEFFGKDITVAGLLTGQDIVKQLSGKELGDALLLPDVLLRSGEEVLLDDMTVRDLEKALQISIRIVQSDGESLLKQIIRE